MKKFMLLFFGLIVCNSLVAMEGRGSIESDAAREAEEADRREDRLEWVRNELKAGRVNAKDEGYTLLMIAAEDGDIDLVKALIESGANISAQSTLGSGQKTALQIAQENKHWDIVKLIEKERIGKAIPEYLKDKDKDFLNKKLVESLGAIAVDLPKVVMLIKAGADPDLQDNLGTALMAAVLYGDGAIVDELIRLGVDLNVQDKRRGATALMNAVAHQEIDLVEKLLRAGADPNLKDINGETALDFASGGEKVFEQKVQEIFEKYKQ